MIPSIAAPNLANVPREFTYPVLVPAILVRGFADIPTLEVYCKVLIFPVAPLPKASEAILTEVEADEINPTP